jgi:hypothetical protein
METSFNQGMANMSEVKFGRDQQRPPGDWSRASGYLEAVGVHHRLTAARQFASAVRDAERQKRLYGVLLRPEPSNPHDKNAIQLIGYCEVPRIFGSPIHKEWHIGYVDRDTAAELNSSFVSKDVKIAGELYGIYVGRDGFIDINYFALAESEAVRKAKQAERDQTAFDALSEVLTKEQKNYIEQGLLGIYRNTRLAQADALKSAGHFKEALEHFLRVAALDTMGVSNAGQGIGRPPKRSEVFSDVFTAPGIIGSVIMGANTVGMSAEELKRLFVSVFHKERACLEKYKPPTDAEAGWDSIFDQIADGLGGRSKWRPRKK